MKVALIVAFDDGIWKRQVVDVPDGVVPDKFHRGSVKWNKAVLKWATDNVKLDDDKTIEFLGVLDANPENEQ
jgi:hypothetical protein